MDTIPGPTNGLTYLVKELRRSQGIPCTKELYDRATVNDEAFCVVALGAKQKAWISDAFIGSGNDAYLFVDRDNLSMIKEPDDLPPEYAGIAYHGIVGTSAAELRDHFDQRKEAMERLVWILASSPSQTREARRGVERARREALKAKKADTNAKTRTTIVVKDTKTTVVNNTAKRQKKAQPENPKKKRSEGDPPTLTKPVAKRRTRMQRLSIPRRRKAPITTD